MELAQTSKNAAQMTQKQSDCRKAVAFGLCSFFLAFPAGEGDHQVKNRVLHKAVCRAAVQLGNAFDAFYAVAMLLGILLGCDDSAVPQWDFRGLLERMAQTVYLDEKIRDTVQCCEVTELILLISQVVTRRHNAPPPSATSLLVAKAVAYLQANYTDPHLTVAQLAKYTYTSREHLSRVFKEYTLESIHGYLTNLRMQHCRNELADGTGVLDACTASGFANYSSFLKSFRALYGITPGEYRAQLRQSRRTP